MAIKIDAKYEQELAELCSERLRRLRLKKGITIKGLAISLGVNVTSIRAYESGKHIIPSRLVKPTCILLDTTPNYLFGWEEEYIVHDDEEIRAKQLIEPDRRLLQRYNPS